MRLLADIAPDDTIVEIFPHDAGRKLLVASKAGFGFVVAETDLISARKAGKRILDVKPPDVAAICAPLAGDMLAVLGTNRKLLCVPVSEIPEMARGKGVRLQRYGKGNLAAARGYDRKTGLQMPRRAIDKLGDWEGKRGQAGKVRPKGFPSDGGMGSAFDNRL